MKIQLAQIAQRIFTGLSTAGRAPEPGIEQTLPIINIKNLVDGEINPAAMDAVAVEDTSKVQRYMVKKRDILLTTRGTLLKSAMVPDELDGYLISSNLAAIRLSQDAPITPFLLKTYFESQLGQQYFLSRFLSGAAKLTLSSRDIGSLELVVPDAQSQEQVERLLLATTQYIKLEKQALESRACIAQQVFTNLFSYETGVYKVCQQ